MARPTDSGISVRCALAVQTRNERTATYPTSTTSPDGGALVSIAAEFLGWLCVSLSTSSHSSSKGNRATPPSLYTTEWFVGRRRQAMGEWGKGNARQMPQPSAASQIGVANRDYHQLSHSEIAGGKRISQHLSRPTCPGPSTQVGY